MRCSAGDPGAGASFSRGPVLTRAHGCLAAGRGRGRTLLGAPLLAAALARPPGAAGASPADASPADAAAYFGATIRAIDYAADRPIDRTRYDPFLPLRVGDTLTRTGVKNAIQAFYDSGRFARVVVEGVPEAGGVRVVLRLTSNTYFNTFSIEGDVSLGARAPWEVMTLPVGERFTVERLEAARQSMLGYLRDRGFYLAEVKVRTSVDPTNRQVDTVFEVSAGKLATVTSLEVRGVPERDVSLIRKRLSIGKGDSYERDRVRRRKDDLRQRLLERGYLGASPDLLETFNPGDNTVALVLEIKKFERVRVGVDGYRIPKERVRRLLPVLSEGEVSEDLLEEGTRNLEEFLEEKGYPESDVSYGEERGKDDVRVLTYKIEQGHKVTVAEVGFRNNRSFVERELLEAIQIQPARFLQHSVYSVQKLDSDVESLRNFYRSRGYLDAEVIPLIETVDGGNRLKIMFEIEEGSLARTGVVSLSGNAALSSDALRRRMSLTQGGPYSPHLSERDRQAVLAAYNDAGFLQPRVSYQASEPDASNSYRVEFSIVEGTRSFVDDVIILGNRRTRESVIDSRIKFEKNDPLSLGKLLESQQALYNVGVFDLVRVNAQNPDSVAPYQDVVVRVQEAKAFTVRYGAGYQERERLRGTLELSHLNIFGTGRRVDLRLRGSRIEQSGLISFQQPQIRFLPVNSYFTVSARQKQEVSFDARRYNVSYQLGHQLNDHSWGLFRYNFRQVKVSNLKVSLSELGREDAPRNLSTFSTIYINDTRDSLIDPEKGFFSSTDLSVTTKLLGSNSYLSLFTQNSYYRRVPADLLFAASLRFGTAHPFAGDTTIPLSERFFAGGGSSLRGFETDRAGPLDPVTNEPIGGNALLIGNLELRVPLFRALRLATFYDTGNVFRSLRDIGVRGFSHTLGLGLRVKTPFGPLRLDYGFNLNLPAALRAQGFRSRNIFVTIGPPF
jgi:outer membrane protein insertion porin family